MLLLSAGVVIVCERRRARASIVSCHHPRLILVSSIVPTMPSGQAASSVLLRSCLNTALWWFPDSAPLVACLGWGIVSDVVVAPRVVVVYSTPNCCFRILLADYKTISR